MGQATVEQQTVATLDAYLDRLLPEFAAELNESANKRLAFFAFLSGGIIGLSLKNGLTPPQSHLVAMALFGQSLKMSPMDSMRMAGHGIDATAGESPWSYAALEGLEEFFAWHAAPDSFAGTRLRQVLDRVPADGVSA